MVLIFLLRWIVIESSFPDLLVAPLMLADTHGTADAIVILGAGVVGDCAPNLNGLRRVLLGVRLWKAGRAPSLVITGGQPVAGCPVAESMVRIARELGVPESALTIETTARSTRENATRTLPLLQAAGAIRVLIVTDRLHMRRAAGSFAALGLHVERASVPVYEGHINNVDMLASGAREAVALGYYAVRGWVGDVHASRRAPRVAAPAPDGPGETVYANPSGPIVVLGASYAMGWPLASVAGTAVINRGGGGQVSTQMLERFDSDVVAARPRAVILWGFINDIFRAPATDMENTLARIRENFTTMVERAEQEGIEPILATEITVRPDDSWTETMARWLGALLGRESYQARINRQVMTMNGWLIELATKKGLIVLDFERVLGDEGGARRREFIEEDGSHITPAGYAALNAYAAPILEAHLGRR